MDDTNDLYGYARDCNIYPTIVCYPTLGREVDIEELALLYIEKYGIIEYHFEHNDGKEYLVYYVSYPMEHATYKTVVDLLKWKTIKRTKLSKYYIPYKSKVGGIYQVDCC